MAYSEVNPTECSGPPHLLGPWGSAGKGAVQSGLLVTPLPAGHPMVVPYGEWVGGQTEPFGAHVFLNAPSF